MQPTKEIVLDSGKKIVIDLNKITIKEYRGLFKPEQSEEQESETLAKVSGLSVDDFNSLGLADFKKLAKNIFEFVIEYSKDLNENPT